MLPHMLARDKGRIVVIGSMSCKLPSPGQAVYAAAKFALFGFFSTLATEIADTCVRACTCVCVRACARARVCVSVCASVCARARARAGLGGDQAVHAREHR